MKKLLFIATALVFAMNTDAQTADQLHTEQGVKANFKNTYSRELNYLVELWYANSQKMQVGDWPNALDNVSDCGSEADLKSSRIISVSDITANTAKAVEELKIECEETISVEKVNLDLVLENGKWVIDDYFGQKQYAKNKFKQAGINTEMLTDLISFADILQTNGELDKLVQTHDYKKKTYSGFREYWVYYKNCIEKNDEIVPYGKGTSVSILSSYNVNGIYTTISVFNDKAYCQLLADLKSFAIKQEGLEYTLKWANGKIITATCTKGQKGGSILLSEDHEP